MDSKSLLALIVFVLLFSNLLTIYLSSKATSQDQHPQKFSLDNHEGKKPRNELAFKYGYENIPFHKRPATPTVHEYLKQRGIPTYEKIAPNYGDLDQIKSEDEKTGDINVELNDNTTTTHYDDNDDDDQVTGSVGSEPGPTPFKKQVDQHKKEIEKLKTDLKEFDKKEESLYGFQTGSYLENNPYRKLDIYSTMPKQYYNIGPKSTLNKKIRFYGIVHNPHYCEQVDLYNLAHQDKVFSNFDFISDYAADEFLIRTSVLPKLGRDMLPRLTALMKISDFARAQFTLPLNTSLVVFKRVNIHHFYETNKQLICFSQLYNHIPGHGVLTRKDLVVDAIVNYTHKYANKPQCIQGNYFPLSYRLHVADECRTFFEEMNSEKYHAMKTQEPLQYIIKAGFGAHRAAGLALLDEDEERNLNTEYDNGKKCGTITKSLVAQRYISNPLVLDKQNKFDFRIYMLVASVKPLIVYYHDGFLRLSLSKYEKNSTQKNVHFTNTHLSKEIFAEAGKHQYYEGMTEGELRDYQMWMMEDLQDYLLKTGKITNENWLEEELRPKFKQAFIHLARMVEDSFYKTSSVFELFGLDFVMDENLNIWFIECNASPQLVGTNKRKTDFLTNMLTDAFDIQYAYFKSRMSRAFKFVKQMRMDAQANKDIDYEKLKEEFDTKINVNKLEPEFKINPNNNFVLIMDKNLEEKDAYLGNLKEECINYN